MARSLPPRLRADRGPNVCSAEVDVAPFGDEHSSEMLSANGRLPVALI